MPMVGRAAHGTSCACTPASSTNQLCGPRRCARWPMNQWPVTERTHARNSLVPDSLANTLNAYAQEVCPVSRPLKAESAHIAKARRSVRKRNGQLTVSSVESVVQRPVPDHERRLAADALRPASERQLLGRHPCALSSRGWAQTTRLRPAFLARSRAASAV